MNELEKLFSNEVRAENEFMFLVFKGVNLYYIDEFGEKHETYFE